MKYHNILHYDGDIMHLTLFKSAFIQVHTLTLGRSDNLFIQLFHLRSLPEERKGHWASYYILIIWHNACIYACFAFEFNYVNDLLCIRSWRETCILYVYLIE